MFTPTYTNTTGNYTDYRRKRRKPSRHTVCQPCIVLWPSLKNVLLLALLLWARKKNPISSIKMGTKRLCTDYDSFYDYVFLLQYNTLILLCINYLEIAQIRHFSYEEFEITSVPLHIVVGLHPSSKLGFQTMRTSVRRRRAVARAAILLSCRFHSNNNNNAAELQHRAEHEHERKKKNYARYTINR